MFQFHATALLSVCALFIVSSIATAAPIVDGRVTAQDGYQWMTTITPTSGTGNAAVQDADLFLYQDPVTYDTAVAVVLPLDYVDNTYGTKDSVGYHTHPSWANKDLGKTFKQDWHKFDHLVGSDKAEFTIWIGDQRATFKLDYLDYSDKNHVVTIRSGVNAKDGRDKDGVVAASATSMEYNLTHVAALTVESPELKQSGDDVLYESVDPLLGDWVYEAVYEFRIDGQYFDGHNVLSSDGFINGFGLSFDSLHASPSKNDDDRDVFNDSTPNQTFAEVPEPTTMAVLGLTSLCVIFRRKNA